MVGGGWCLVGPPESPDLILVILQYSVCIVEHLNVVRIHCWATLPECHVQIKSITICFIGSPERWHAAWGIFCQLQCPVILILVAAQHPTSMLLLFYRIVHVHFGGSLKPPPPHPKPVCFL